jgi:hypothetical protein
MKDVFITGSRAYGTPREDSDIDLVIFCSVEDARTLLNYNEASVEEIEEAAATIKGYGDEGILQVRYGRLNLILCVDDARYAEWVGGTVRLKAIAPVTRAQAIALLEEIRSR